jgi:hypothetical protein
MRRRRGFGEAVFSGEGCSSKGGAAARDRRGGEAGPVREDKDDRG